MDKYLITEVVKFRYSPIYKVMRRRACAADLAVDPSRRGAAFEIAMPLLFTAAALCVAVAVVSPLVFGLRAMWLGKS